MAVPAAQSALQPSEVNAAGQLNQHEMSLAEFVSPQPLASAAVLSQLDALPHMPLPVPRCLLCGPRRRCAAEQYAACSTASWHCVITCATFYVPEQAVMLSAPAMVLSVTAPHGTPPLPAAVGRPRC